MRSLAKDSTGALTGIPAARDLVKEVTRVDEILAIVGR
jgi:hypothetical protein